MHLHWAERIADRIIASSPDKGEYVCAAGISPSGSIHIGNFRDIATSYFVCQALKRRGKNARLLFSWDEFDRLRKVPSNVAKLDDSFGQYIGKPYTDVPDPFGCCASYGKHFEVEFERALSRFGIQVDFRYQTAEYRSGRYVNYIIEAIQKRKEIFDILESFRTQDSEEGKRESYFPVSIYCPVCGKDETHITAFDDATYRAEYTCRCGYSGTFDFKNDHNCKLAWKIDWPMRWIVEGVDFEPGGKDHASPMGSYQTSKVIIEKIFGHKPPIFQGYEFIGIKGSTGKMSGSSGLNLTPEELFRLYQPEIILWLYAKTDPMKAFNFCFDDEILRQYFEFDKAYTAYRSGATDDLLSDAMSYSVIAGREIHTVPMAQLVSFGSIVDFSPELLEEIFRKIGTPYTRAEFEERLDLAKYWLIQCSPESIYRLRGEFNAEYYDGLADVEKSELACLVDYLNAGGYDMEKLQTDLYRIPALARGGEAVDEKALKEMQAAFFKNVYRMILGVDKGPRLYLFLFALDKSQYIHLLAPNKVS